MIVFLTYCGIVGIVVMCSILIEPKVTSNVGIETSFMGRHHTEVMKGFAILCVIISHIGNVNSVRLAAPGGV